MIQRYSKHKTCILRYENLTKDLIHELMPCLEFLGFGLDPILVECILQGTSYQTVKSNLAMREGRTDISDMQRHLFSKKKLSPF